MREELVQKEGYVVRAAPYKETDLIVTALGKDGLFSFLARGGNKINGKNAAACRVLTYSRFSLLLSSDKERLTLKESEPILTLKEEEDLAYMSCVFFLSEINSRLLGEEDALEAFPYFDKAMKNIDNGYPIYSACLLYFAKLIVILGYGLEVNKCVISEKKNDIVGINYLEGGFISKGYEDSNTTLLNSRMLKILRYSFIYPLNDFGRVSFNKEESISLILQLSSYLESMTGVKLKSTLMLERC